MRMVHEGTFGWALENLWVALRLTRRGWNGTGLYIYLVPESRFVVNRSPLNNFFPEGTEVSYGPHIDMRTANGEFVPWVASQSDLLATDWEITSG